MNKLKKIILSILTLLLTGSGGYYVNDQLGSFQGADYVSNIQQGTTSVSVAKRSIYYKEPTSTDASVPTADTHLRWVFATSTDIGGGVISTSTTIGTPDKIPNYSDNQGFELCIDADQTSQAIRFWTTNATSSDETATSTKMTVGANSSGFLLTAGNCWDSREFGIIYGGPIYAIASTTGSVGTSTVRYTIFR